MEKGLWWEGRRQDTFITSMHALEIRKEEIALFFTFSLLTLGQGKPVKATGGKFRADNREENKNMEFTTRKRGNDLASL